MDELFARDPSALNTVLIILEDKEYVRHRVPKHLRERFAPVAKNAFFVHLDYLTSIHDHPEARLPRRQEILHLNGTP